MRHGVEQYGQDRRKLCDAQITRTISWKVAGHSCLLVCFRIEWHGCLITKNVFILGSVVL